MPISETASQLGCAAMKTKRGKSGMLIPTLILAGLALILVYMGYRRGEGQHIAGLKGHSPASLRSLGTVPVFLSKCVLSRCTWRLGS